MVWPVVASRQWQWTCVTTRWIQCYVHKGKLFFFKGGGGIPVSEDSTPGTGPYSQLTPNYLKSKVSGRNSWTFFYTRIARKYTQISTPNHFVFNFFNLNFLSLYPPNSWNIYSFTFFPLSSLPIFHTFLQPSVSRIFWHVQCWKTNCVSDRKFPTANLIKISAPTVPTPPPPPASLVNLAFDTDFLIPEMETKFYVPVVVNNIRVITYFTTNLAITLIRQSVAEALRCALSPVSGADISFIDPTTSHVFPILWETSLTLHTKD
jgi:hypothetical protein